MPHATVEKARGLTESQIGALAAELRAGLRGEVRAGRHDRLLYATDASIYQMEPIAVVFPDGAEDVQHVLTVAREHGVPVLPRGGGTSLAGQTVNHAIVLDFTPKMGKVLEIDAEAGWARVQPGLVLASLNRAAAPYKLQYAVDPSTANRATIGGGIGNNSCGAHSVIYGKTLDQVLSIDTVLADATTATFSPVEMPLLGEKLAAAGLEGTLYREMRRIGQEQRDEVSARFPKIMRRVSGYNLDELADEGQIDLSKLIVGSEGTLAVITEAKMRLVPVPPVKALAAVHFRDVPEASDGTLVALEHGPSAVELIDDTIIRRCRANPSFRHLAEYVQGDPGALLLVELYAESAAEAEAKLERLNAGFQRRVAGAEIVSTIDPARQRNMWRMREAGLGLLMSIPGDTKPIAIVEDTAVAPERLGEFVRRFQSLVGNHNGGDIAYYGHASVGCLHIRPMVNIKDAEGLETIQAIASEVADLVLEFDGSLSGEHGDGILRGVFTEKMFGPRLTEAFREVKRTFDPAGLLNPGKIIDTPSFSENLRLSPETRNVEPLTFLDFSREGGIARAAEQCNGQGACRKLDGTMCPSYMVTLDEEHSTRGRANLLRLAFAGTLPHADLTSERLHDALDLCVECKACKSECPSGVDMAKLKYEVLTQYHRAHGLPLRARLFANIRRLGRLGSKAPLIANTLAGLAPARALMHRFGGVHRDRPLPRLANRRFERWFAGRAVDPEPAPRGDVVYFHDTFTDLFNPEVGVAATRVLEALGFRVHLVEKLGCCGRPAISKGMLNVARGWAKRNVDLLLPWAERGVPVVGTEPSCLLTLRDEYPDLLRDAAARKVAESALLLDELIMQLAAQEPGIATVFRPDLERKIVLHGHCHQKAIVGVEPTVQALSLVPGYTVQTVDSGCCGMAGSFGFEAEHYDISRKMGELRLFPAVEAAAPEAAIAVTGVSCRQQIGHFTSRRPRHAVELLAEALN